jgi:hypothetical protein
MDDYLTFRKMITPIIIQVIFWLVVVVVVLSGLVTMFSDSFFGGLLIIVFGPLVVRIYCEILIVIFRMNDTLTDIRNELREQGKAKNQF